MFKSLASCFAFRCSASLNMTVVINEAENSRQFVRFAGKNLESKDSLRAGALSEEFRDIEIHKIGVMKYDRFDRALDLVSLMAMCGYDVQHFAGNAVLVGERNAQRRQFATRRRVARRSTGPLRRR